VNESSKSNETSVNKALANLNVSFNIFNPSKKDAFIFVPDNFDVPIKKITSVTENDSKFRDAPTRKLFVEFAQNPKVNLKTFSAENKAYLITWITETLFYIGISEATVPFVDMMRLLVSDPGFAEALITKSPERVEELFEYMNKKDEELIAMPRGLKMIILRFLTNIAAHPKAVEIFKTNTPTKLLTLVRMTRALKDDRASNYACLMLLFNLILLLEENPEYRTTRKEIVPLMQELMTNEKEEKNLLAIVVNLTWLIYDNKDLKSKANERSDKVKLSKLEESENSILRLATQDLIQVLENKL